MTALALVITGAVLALLLAVVALAGLRLASLD